MGFSACFGGPMLNILLGVGISGIYITGQTSDHYLLDFSTTLVITGAGLLVILLTTLIFVPWNNYFLPLIMLRSSELFPLTIGLNAWNNQASTAGGDAVFNLVITGSLLTIIPLAAAFLLLQRFWQAGLAAGGVKE